MSATPIQADARCLPLPDASVDLIITSPPYFALRSYRDDGAHYDGQVGSEPTPKAFLEALWEVSKEAWRVLKPTGSYFVNLGDKRSGSGGHNNAGLSRNGVTGSLNGKTTEREAARHELSKTIAKATRRNAPDRYNQAAFGRPKSKMLLPHRFAIGCEDGMADPEGIGWIVRQDIVWNKPNGLPESVVDRVRDSHEMWFHLTKQGRYFSAVDEIREPHSQSPGAQAWRRLREPGHARYAAGDRNDLDTIGAAKDNPLGKLPGSVWTIASEPLTIPEAVKAHYDLPDHFAAFPQEWPRRLILGWSPSGVCVGCGEGRRPVVVKEYRPTQVTNNVGRLEANADNNFVQATRPHGRAEAEVIVTGYACACPDDSAPTKPAVVVDIFGGTGTVAGVARQLGRTGISFDLSWDYGRLAKWFFADGRRFAKTSSRTDKERQGELFSLQGGQGAGGVPGAQRPPSGPGLPVPGLPAVEAVPGLWDSDISQGDVLCEMSGQGRTESAIRQTAPAACEGRRIEGAEGRTGPEAGNAQTVYPGVGARAGESSLPEANDVRAVRRGEAAGLAPHRRGRDEQRAVEPRSVVPALPPNHGRPA